MKMSIARTVNFNRFSCFSRVFSGCTQLVRFNSSVKDTERNILRSACKDVEIRPTPLANFIWDNSTSLYPDKIALVDGVSGKSHTYKMAANESKCFGSSLVKIGMAKGDVLAIMMTNCPEYLIAFLGVTGIGGTVTTINPSYTASEVGRQLIMSKTKYILTAKKSLRVVEDAIGKIKRDIKIIVLDDEASPHLSYPKMIKDDGSGYPDQIPDFNFNEDVAALPYSSGTTGLPKGVMLTHGNLVSNITQMYYCKELQFLPPTTETFQPTTICVLPMFHIFGLNVVGLPTLHCGGKIVTLPSFEPKSFIDALEEHRPDCLHFAPPLVAFCCHNSDVKPHHLENLMHIKVGAAPVGETLINQFREKAPHVLFREGWGMTELSPVGTMTGIKNIVTGSCGVLAPNTEGKIVNLETGEPVGPGETGELCIRGPQVMKGYLDDPVSTKATITDDGWLHSGDIAKYDETHHIYIVDRLKELIKVKGYQVPPAELEDLIRSIPEVEDVAVIGVPDDKSGEVARAYIVPKSDAALTEIDVHKFVNDHVAKYKRLDGGIEFVASIPKSAAGKILRKDLKALYEQKFGKK